MPDQFKAKILIMGANPETIPLVQSARKAGFFVYVTDNNPEAPAKVYASEAVDIDGFDVQGLAQFVRSKNIDAILVGVADCLIEPYRQVCEMTGKYCYATALQTQVLTDKAEFNWWCSERGIQPIPSYRYESIVAQSPGGDLIFPVLVKPVDANSGKGMSLVRTLDELQFAKARASKLSPSGRVLLERYMECDDLLIYYTFIDGQCLVSAIGDRFTNRVQEGAAPVCVGAVYPSKYSELYWDKFHKKFLKLFEDLDIRQGVLLISAFVENDELYVYDPGFRLQGEAMNHHLQAINGFDQYRLLLNYALTGKAGDHDIILSKNDPLFGGEIACTVWWLLSNGTIDRIQGMADVEAHPSVHTVVQRLHVGDCVEEAMIGTEAQVFARVYLRAKSCCELDRAIIEINQAMRVDD